MKTKILLGTLLAGALSASLYASGYNMPNNNPGMMGPQNMQRGNMMNCNHKKGMKAMHKRGGRMMMFANLNLSPEQRYQLSILRDEMKLDMKKARGFKRQGKMVQFIKGDHFDKDAFIKYSNKMHEKMVEIRANHMEKVLKVLTKEQVTQLKQNLAQPRR
ncbi:Spy/CpxP family protein refolding chaperone [Sulfurospirillum sp. 1612]|uniref:Spy/CpxP family protein refolding chaperone n=1 Tax=Sulfurospirillum sp. 1612 TaxID=3094835 RepID=UPI002F95C8F6